MVHDCSHGIGLGTASMPIPDVKVSELGQEAQKARTTRQLKEA